MGSCVSTHHHQKHPSSSSSREATMKVEQVLLFGSSNHIVKPPPPIINNNTGSKEETFFDSQAWLDSDCDDDFMSVNGDFTPSRGNTPVHHKFSAGNNKPPVSFTNQPSPNGSEKKMRLSDLFNDSQRRNYDSDFEDDGVAANKNDVQKKVESPLVHGVEVLANGGNHLKSKRERFGRSVQNCFPSLISSRSSSINGRKMMSPGLSPSPNPVVG